MAAAMQRVPLTQNTKVRIGSTANGEGNDFFEAYFSAKEGKALGKSIFKAHFYTWWMMPDYSMKKDSYLSYQVMMYLYLRIYPVRNKIY